MCLSRLALYRDSYRDSYFTAAISLFVPIVPIVPRNSISSVVEKGIYKLRGENGKTTRDRRDKQLSAT